MDTRNLALETLENIPNYLPLLLNVRGENQVDSPVQEDSRQAVGITSPVVLYAVHHLFVKTLLQAKRLSKSKRG